MTRILDGVDGHGRSSPEKQHMQTIWIQRPRSPLMPLALEAASPRRQTLRQNHSLREDVKKKKQTTLVDGSLDSAGEEGGSCNHHTHVERARK